MNNHAQVVEEIKRVLSQIVTEEYEAIMKKVENGEATLSDKEITPEMIRQLFDPKD